MANGNHPSQVVTPNHDDSDRPTLSRTQPLAKLIRTSPLGRKCQLPLGRVWVISRLVFRGLFDTLLVAMRTFPVYTALILLPESNLTHFSDFHLFV